MTTTATLNEQFDATLSERRGRLRGLPFWGSLIAFGAPALLMIFSYHVFMPRLIVAGLSAAESFAVAHIAPMAVLLAVSLHVFHNAEGWPLTWAAFGRRFRYPRLTLRAALLGLGAFVALNVAYGAFSQASLALFDLSPSAGVIASVSDALDQSVQGRWEIVFLFLLVLFFNVVGEELWWRGIILPRQEATHGRWTWIVHGLLWTAFHVFKWWDLIGLLPVCLVIAYVSQRTRNNWPALIAHGLFNGLALFLVIAAVMGS
ncbi:MAG: CPBP family intramembrane metalloprotease [Chloroflexota bacterium]|jgi:membrane protease YdiL (CAAX protease family)